MEAIVRGYHVYKEIWCAAEVIDHLLRDLLIYQAIKMATPLANCAYLGREIYVQPFILQVEFLWFANQLRNVRKLDPAKIFRYTVLITPVGCD